MSCSNFLKLIKQFQKPVYLQRYIKEVREKSLLESSREMEILLESLVLSVEQQQKAKLIVSKINELDIENKIQKTISKSPELTDWYEKSFNRNISPFKKFFYFKKDIHNHQYPFSNSNNETLDELSMLLEQVRLRRRD